MKLLPILTLLVTFALFGTPVTGSGPLPEQLDRRDTTDRPPTQHELRRRPITMVADSLVSGPGGSGTEVLTLNLFPDENPLTAHLVELRRRGRDNFTWYGIIEDDVRSLVLLTAVGGFVDGTVLHKERMFRIKPSRSGAHYAIEVARNSFGPINDIGPRDRFPTGGGGTGHWHPGLAKPWFIDMFRIDVLVAFTAQVSFEYGEAVHAVIQSNIDTANMTLYASGVATQLRLVHTEFEWYDEHANFPARWFASHVRHHLETKNDGWLEGVHVQRDAHAADIVVLLTKWDAGCGDLENRTGIADQNNGPGNGFDANSAFAVVDADCSIDNGFAFSHEVGHLLGAGHDAGASQPPMTNVPYARGHIHVFDDQSVKARDIMSYPTACEDCNVAPLFSNPDILYPTSLVNQTTKPFGSPTKADNRRRMNELAPWVSGFR
jgi:hypothetical protein